MLDLDSWQDAAELSTIRRINWKLILGKCFAKRVLDLKKQGYSQDEIVHIILLQCKHQNIHLIGLSWPEIVKNVKIGVSARFTEIKIYQKEEELKC